MELAKKSWINIKLKKTKADLILKLNNSSKHSVVECDLSTKEFRTLENKEDLHKNIAFDRMKIEIREQGINRFGKTFFQLNQCNFEDSFTYMYLTQRNKLSKRTVIKQKLRRHRFASVNGRRRIKT